MGAMVWPVVVVVIWAALFLTTLSFVRWVAHEHDQESDAGGRQATS